MTMKKQYIAPEISAYEIKLQYMLALSKTEDTSNGSGGLAPRMDYDFGVGENQDSL